MLFSRYGSLPDEINTSLLRSLLCAEVQLPGLQAISENLVNELAIA